MQKLATHDPMDDALVARRRVRKALDDMLGWRSHIVFTRDITWQPPLDVYETDSEIHVKVEIAGTLVEQLDITVDRDVLTIAGSRDDPTLEGADVRCVHHREIDCGRFQRSITLPSRVDRDTIRALLKDGFLDIFMRKATDRTGPLSVDIS